MSVKEKSAMVAYVPVLHEGYRRFFDRHKKVGTLYVLGKDVTNDYRPLTKDIRALSPDDIVSALKGWKRFKTIKILNKAGLKKLSAQKDLRIIMNDDSVSKDIAQRYFVGAKVANVKYDSSFLRWDEHKSFEQKPVEANQSVSTDDFDNEVIVSLREEADKSTDWWRRVASAVVKNRKVMLRTHNHHLPSQHAPYVDGDPRCDFKKGVNLELSTAIHSEAALIAEAAKRGMSLEGAALYVTTFPCPPCAKLIAHSGIKEIYYADGYGVLDGERVLRSNGVKIIFVKAKE